MNAIQRNIPNILTVLNLTCGIFAILFAVIGMLKTASICIFIGAVFDFSDGLLARLLKASSELGKQLDSLADLICFGVAPGFILFQLIYISLYEECFSKDFTSKTLWMTDDYHLTQGLVAPAIIAFLIPIFSAIRLAKFNLDTKQASSFIGLPTPAAAIFIASLPLLSENNFIELSSALLIGVALIFSALLVAPLPLFSFKMSKGMQLKTKENIIRFFFLISSLILLISLGYDSIPIIVILYLILSLLNNIIKL